MDTIYPSQDSNHLNVNTLDSAFQSLSSTSIKRLARRLGSYYTSHNRG